MQNLQGGSLARVVPSYCTEKGRKSYPRAVAWATWRVKMAARQGRSIYLQPWIFDFTQSLQTKHFVGFIYRNRCFRPYNSYGKTFWSAGAKYEMTLSLDRKSCRVFCNAPPMVFTAVIYLE